MAIKYLLSDQNVADSTPTTSQYFVKLYQVTGHLG